MKLTQEGLLEHSNYPFQKYTTNILKVGFIITNVNEIFVSAAAIWHRNMPWKVSFQKSQTFSAWGLYF